MSPTIDYLLALPCLLTSFLHLYDCNVNGGNGDINIQTQSHRLPNPANPSAANLTDSAFSLDHYATLLQEPYSSYPCMPKRIHLSQANNVREIPLPTNESHFHNQTIEFALDMTVSFSLDFEKCKNATPTVWYRQGFHPETKVIPGEAIQFNYSSSINGTDFFQSDWIYHVTLPNVKAGGHRYWYRMEVHDSNKKDSSSHNTEAAVFESGRQLQMLRGSSQRLQGKTPNYSFMTAPLPNTPTAIAVVGDLGQTKNSTKTMAHILHDSISSDNKENKNPTSLLLIAGDMAYADSDPLRWLSWFDLMEPLTRSLPMHVAAGNHEIECDNATLEVFKQYEHYFLNPNRIAEADLEPITSEYRQTLWEHSCSTPSEFRGHYNYGNAFYSFQHGYIHVIVLGSYSDTRRGSPQYEWLVEELKFNVDRNATPWLIVSFHSPLYTTFMGHVNESQSLEMKASMEPLFNRYNVNLVISGHDHGYMRTHSLNQNGTVDESGKSPIYLTLGAGGNREQHSKGFRQPEPEEWVAKRDLRDFGYGNLVVENATHATLTWIRDKVSGAGDDSDDKNIVIINPHYHGPNSTSNNGTVDDTSMAPHLLMTQETNVQVQ